MTPVSTPSFTLFAAVFFVWQAANYLPTYPIADAKPRPRPKKIRWEALVLLRGCLSVVAVCWSAGWHGGWELGVFSFLACFGFPLARGIFVKEKWLAEFEILGNLMFAVCAVELIAWTGAGTSSSLAALSVRFPQMARYAVSAGLLLFSIRGGTNIVRGLLARGGTMPPGPAALLASESPVPTVQAELNHGRLIGIVERLILVLLIANGQFASMAFFFAAKGLIRSKDLELRAWADYLLLGSLASFLTALVIGLLIERVMR
jgi:hypothetical protein